MHPQNLPCFPGTDDVKRGYKIPPLTWGKIVQGRAQRPFQIAPGRLSGGSNRIGDVRIDTLDHCGCAMKRRYKFEPARMFVYEKFEPLQRRSAFRRITSKELAALSLQAGKGFKPECAEVRKVLENNANRESRTFCDFACGRRGNPAANESNISPQDAFAALLTNPLALDGAAVEMFFHLSERPRMGQIE